MRRKFGGLHRVDLIQQSNKGGNLINGYSIIQRFPLKTYCHFFIKEKEQSLGILCRVLDEREEVVIDRQRNVFDPILSVCSILVSKEHLWQYKSQRNYC